jgi:hypothetical protein
MEIRIKEAFELLKSEIKQKMSILDELDSYEFEILIKDMDFTVHKRLFWNIIATPELKGFLNTSFPGYRFKFRKAGYYGYFYIIVSI